MNALLINLVLVCSFSDSPQEAIDATIVKTPVKEPQVRIGQIFVTGNDRTKMSVILDQVGLYPGQTLSYPMIRQAEKNLARLGIFKYLPTITVRDCKENPASEYKDVFIRVEEDNTTHASLKHSRNAKGDWVIHLVVEERNFDPWCFPRNIDDIMKGNAFRGAGLTIGVDAQLTVPLSPLSVPYVTLVAKLPDSRGR
jgi:outer membrane protein assembly factor BamA